MGTSGLNHAFNPWVSGIFAPELGTLGSYVCWGGGHMAGIANIVLRYDLAARVWSSMGTPSSYNESSIDSIGALPDGRPAGPHTYHTLGIRSSANGGGANGSLVSATLPAVDANGNGRMERWWQFNFATQQWSQFIDATSLRTGQLTFKTMVQEPGSHFWWFGGGDVSNIARVTQAGVITQYNVGLNTGSAFCGGVVPGARILVLNGTFSSHQTWLFNLANIEAGQTGANASKQIFPSGTPGEGEGSLAWNPDVQGFACIVNSSPSTVRWLKPANPANPWDTTWAWASETFSAVGGASAYTVENNGRGRFVYAPAIKCHIHASRAENPVQVYRPQGS